MNAKLTIFTPTYNRGGTLRRGFEALKRQSRRDFLWLIIDDGSTDDTEQVVKSFQQEDCGFPIRYIKKENGGLHTGYNTAIEHMDTELCMCIDSDDWIADGAVEAILSAWERVDRDDCAGIVGYDTDPDGNVLCRLHTQQEYVDLNAYDAAHKWEGDRKLVIKTALYKEVYPMAVFGSEKNFNPQYMHIKIAREHVFYVLRKPLCVVEYQQQGMSAGIFRQFADSPNSFAEFRRLQMTVKPNRASKIVRYAIHYDSSCILAGKPAEIITKSPRKLLTALVSPLGLALSLYILRKAK